MHLIIKIEDIDSENIAISFKETFEFIEKARKVTNVLIHCQAGISRSATVLIAYLVRKNRIIVREAMELVRSKRWQIYPNNGTIILF
jgi:protein-tyrosine phosphatase